MAWVIALDGRFPSGFIGPFPECFGRRIVLDVTVGRVAGQYALCALGNVAQVTEQDALVAFIHWGG
jgi:hypothetical protein